VFILENIFKILFSETIGSKKLKFTLQLYNINSKLVILIVREQLEGFPPFKDGVLSAFEHHCSGSYNLPFTGFILIPIGADLLRITTKHYPMRKKVCELEF
jgi:hypothetical protein